MGSLDFLNFAAARSFDAGDIPRSIMTGDFNGDGRPHLAVTNLDDDTVSVLLSTCGAP